MIYSVLFGIMGGVVALMVTPWMIRLADREVGLDHPDQYRKTHERVVSRLGGVPLFFVFVLAIGLVIWLRPEWGGRWLVVGSVGALMFGLGLWDDLKPVGARVKLFCQILIAGFAVLLGLDIESVSWPGQHVSFELGSWGTVVAILWLISVPNVINLIDGVDGLASGLGLFLFCTLGYIGWNMGQTDVAWVSFALAGALLGFLCFNFPPAKIFLGDGGAYLIGVSIAAISLVSANKGAVAAALLVTMIALGLPVMDTLFALIRRGLRGFPLFRADAEHIHHRLRLLGLSERRIVLAMYLTTVVFSLVGLSIFWSQGRTLPIAIAILFLVAVFMVRYLGYIWGWSELSAQVVRSMERRKDVRYTLLQAQLLEMEVERCATLEEFRARMVEALRRVGFVVGGPVDPQRYLNITLYFIGQESIVLQAPNDAREQGHWQRLAECFREPYKKALQRWSP
jgi:UDP-GlcNAc:undecaprenyl-phosphate GlcNAc-1-phosphate transferase